LELEDVVAGLFGGDGLIVCQAGLQSYVALFGGNEQGEVDVLAFELLSFLDFDEEVEGGDL
jgi:hypothetical protein